jgi:multiple sugar transport system substrate-binding protein
MSRDRVAPDVTRRQVLKYGAATGTGITLAGCLGGSGGGEGNELVILNKETTDESLEWFDRATEEFESQYDVETTVDNAGLDLVEVATSMIQTGNPADLATMALDQVGPFLEADQLQDVSDVIGVYESEYGEIPESERLLMDDNDYLLPIWSNPTQLWFWEDIYEEYGFDTEPGVTWDELREIAQTIDEGEDDMYGFTVPLGGDRQTGFFFWNFLVSNSGQLCHVEDGEIDIAIDVGENRERTVETLEFLDDMHEYSPAGTDYAWAENLETFVGRTSAHCLYGPRAKLNVIQNRPDYIDQVKPHFPVANREEQLLNLPDGFVLFDASQNDEVAKDFTEFIAEEGYLVDLLTSVSPVHNWPTIPEVAEMDEYRNAEFIDENFTDDELDTIATSFESGISFATETQPDMLNPYGASLLGTLEIGNLVYEVVAEGTSPEDAIDEYAEILRDELESIRGD